MSKKDIAWNNAHIIRGKNSDLYRKDDYGNLMYNHHMEDKVRWDGK